MSAKVKKSAYSTSAWKRFFKNKPAISGLITLAVVLLLVIILPPFLPSQFKTDAIAFSSPPSGTHLLGTDDVGRDILSRLVSGGRVSLFVGLVSTLISLAIGVPFGMLAAFYRRGLETVIMRLADIFMSFPSVILILFLVSIFGPSIITVTFVIGIMGWPEFARLIYGNVLTIREKEYVEAATAIGAKDRLIMSRYILPNSIAPIIIAVTFRVATAIVLESSLSFLGMGVQPPQSSWGNMLYNAESITVLSSRPWMWVPPGLALIVTILSINFVGNGLRDTLDPKTKV